MASQFLRAALCCGALAATQGISAASLDGDPSNEAYFFDFAGFDGSTVDPADFTLPTGSGDVGLSGSTVGVGNFSAMTPLLYNGDFEAWIAEPGDVLNVVFPVPVAVLEFYAATVDAAQIAVFGEVNELAQVDLVPGSAAIYSFSGAIEGFQLTNLSGEPDFDICSAYCASIDDLGFSPAVVPIPAAVWLFGSGLGLLVWLRRRYQP